MEALVNQATDEKQTRENWALFIRICEQSSVSPEKARETVAAIAKRVAHKNANVSLFALTLANCLVQNCPLSVHREVSSRVLVDALVRQLMASSVHRAVRMRIAELIQTWAGIFKGRQELGYLVDTYNQLKQQGVQFPSPNEKPETVKSASALAKEQEEEELQLALALSMSAQEQKSNKSSARNNSEPPAPPTPSTRNPICRVRALYDFPGLEEGELRLTYNDIINVHDDTTFKEWWKGECNGRVGIFPSNYVGKVEGGGAPGTAAASGGVDGLSDEQKVERFVSSLANANPRESLSENAKIQELYHAVMMLRPKLLSELEVSRAKQDELVTLNDRFTAACATYQKLMDASLAAQRAAYQQQPQYNAGYGGGYAAPYQQQGPPPPQQYQQYAQAPPQQQYQQPPPGQYAPPPQGYYQQ
ncbi:hypothetical protein BCR33DRAFT_675530 [Rhizoclosmatium globosum]|uniref:Class E vacuolar protein-sorting machinery protein HSE1 n=1 Tax=Rhizoclosmatium globosum TaxID=329046 RepID=A0A1Y2D087_9FUNG|nr:hypothetical protein BCR33DRAFT_675530 [Rhizoclosmatium globosum]|eukprot:ORY52680.1 hypothetical protein BCR33DRAFT_675530 [Rhizoclosmatium globosum]